MDSNLGYCELTAWKVLSTPRHELACNLKSLAPPIDKGQSVINSFTEKFKFNNTLNRKQTACKQENITTSSEKNCGIEPKQIGECKMVNRELSDELRESEAVDLLETRAQFQVMWRQLSYEVSAGDSLISLTGSAERVKRLVFDNLNGHFKSGEITAILGPSGAGKTSLLNAICGRTKGYRGTIRLRGGGTRRMRLSIIPQKDYLLAKITVRETLLYSSRLLNMGADFDHEANILRVVEMLNLVSCIDSSVSKISGGEYKRVSIAQELLRQPDILVLDEPTSGLDSLNCKKLIKSLVNLVEASRLGSIQPLAVVLTIHQPDVDIFQMFDRVYCMAPRGRVVFDGHPSQVLSVLHDQAGFGETLKATLMAANGVSLNSANLLIDIASEDLYGQEPVERLARFQRKQFEVEISGLFSIDPVKQAELHEPIGTVRDSPIYPMETFTIKTDNKSSDMSLVSRSTFLDSRGLQQLRRDKRLDSSRNQVGNFWHQTNILTRRTFTASLRDPMIAPCFCTFYFSIPIIFWAVFGRDIGSARACPLVIRDLEMVSMASDETMSMLRKLQEELSTAIECSTMWLVIALAFSGCSMSIAALVFPLNMHVLLKEVRNGWYSLPSYVVAKTLASFPFEVVLPTISAVMIYLLLGMPSSDFSWRLWSIAFVMSWTAVILHTYGLIFGALFMNSAQTAVFVGGASNIPQIITSGLILRASKLPVIIQKLSWLSAFRYSSETVNLILFGFNTCQCDARTEEYLSQNVQFKDVPSTLASTFIYYLRYENPALEKDSTNMSENLIPGVSYDLTLNDTKRAELIDKFESKELSLFNLIASMMSKSISYGRHIDSCGSLRSEVLARNDALGDEWLPVLFLSMLAMLVAMKLVLFVVVKFKIGQKI